MPDSPVGLSGDRPHDESMGGWRTTDQETDRDARAPQVVAVMAETGQRLAVQWGHEPWSDAWARLVAETMLDAQRCPACGDALLDYDHYECVVGEPR